MLHLLAIFLSIKQTFTSVTNVLQESPEEIGDGELPGSPSTTATSKK